MCRPMIVHRTDEGRDRDKAHGADKLFLGKSSNHSETADRHHHGTAVALQNTAEEEDQRVNAVRDPASTDSIVNTAMAAENSRVA